MILPLLLLLLVVVVVVLVVQVGHWVREAIQRACERDSERASEPSSRRALYGSSSPGVSVDVPDRVQRVLLGEVRLRRRGDGVARELARNRVIRHLLRRVRHRRVRVIGVRVRGRVVSGMRARRPAGAIPVRRSLVRLDDGQALLFLLVGVRVSRDVEVHRQDARQLGRYERADGQDERRPVPVLELRLVHRVLRLVADLTRYSAYKQDDAGQRGQT